jgi:hypothetical protein
MERSNTFKAFAEFTKVTYDSILLNYSNNDLKLNILIDRLKYQFGENTDIYIKLKTLTTDDKVDIIARETISRTLDYLDFIFNTSIEILILDGFDSQLLVDNLTFLLLCYVI